MFLSRSRQIRPPIYSMKQSKLRRKRVFRYAVLYFIMLVVFVGLIVGPAVVGKKILPSVSRPLGSTRLVQPFDQNNDDTLGHSQTGTGANNYSGVYKTPKPTATASSTAKKARAV